MSALTVVPFAAAPGSIFSVNSYIVHGATEGIIVDTQFERSNALALVEQARAVGVTITAIVITHNDPDFYFGAAEVMDAFGDARVFSTAATAQLIARTQEAKQEIWNPQLGDNAPRRIVAPTPITGPLTVDGVEITVRGTRNDPDHTYLWIEQDRVALGGIYLGYGQHLWLADSRADFTRQLWIRSVTELRDSTPSAVYPAHTATPVPPAGANDAIEFTLGYLQTVENVLAENDTTDTVVAAITAAYPDLPGAGNLPLGIGVIEGDAEWSTAATFAGEGHTWTADFGPFAFTLDFTVPGVLTFVGVKGDGFVGLTDTMPYQYELVGVDTYLLSWTETLGSRVVHLEDFASGIVHTVIAAPDGSVTRRTGTLRPAA